MDFKTYATEKRSIIEKSLRGFLKKKNEGDLPQSIKDLRILENLEEFSLRGKMLRGILFLFGCEMLGKKITQEEIDIACAIELVHSALLIHDDIIDNDHLRRGEKTIFAKYIDRGKIINALDREHYGKSMGIVAADAAFFLAAELLSNYDKKYLNEILKFYSNEIYLVAMAEGLDSELGQRKKNASIDEILTVYRLKTARYTFSMPLIMASIVCGVSDNTRKQLDELGENAGLVFQIKDDELGLFGDEKDTGKPVGSDIRENKKTIIRSFLFASVSNDEKDKLNKIFGNNDLKKNELNYVLDLLKKYKIKEKSMQEIEKLMVKVWYIFENLKIEKKHKEILKELLEFNIKRNN